MVDWIIGVHGLSMVEVKSAIGFPRYNIVAIHKAFGGAKVLKNFSGYKIEVIAS